MVLILSLSSQAKYISKQNILNSQTKNVLSNVFETSTPNGKRAYDHPNFHGDSNNHQSPSSEKRRSCWYLVYVVEVLLMTPEEHTEPRI